MSSGSIDAQERVELKAAEQGMRLTRQADYKRQYSTLYSLTPEQIAQMSPDTLVWRQQDEDMHQRIHQATVEYICRNVLGERVTQQQIANEFGVEKNRIRWRLKMFRGYSERRQKRQEERARQQEEQWEEQREEMHYYFLDEKTYTPIPVDLSTAEMSVGTILYGVVNVDISDDIEPILYIHRYVYPKRVYQVIRKEWDEDTEGEFEPDPEYDTKSWSVSSVLLHEYDPEDEGKDVFAIVYRDEENPPMNSPDEINQKQADPCFLVTYDPEDKRYKCELWGFGEDVTKAKEQDEDAFEQIAAQTLRTAIDQGVALLDRLIENSVK
jgi:hypothetical protein